MKFNLTKHLSGKISVEPQEASIASSVVNRLKGRVQFITHNTAQTLLNSVQTKVRIEMVGPRCGSNTPFWSNLTLER